MEQANTVVQVVNGYERHLQLVPPWDKRIGDKNKNYGIHGMELIMTVAKNNRAVQFVAYLGIHLPYVAKELFEKSLCNNFNPFEGMGTSVDYHSPVELYEGMSKVSECFFTGGDCYYGGSSLKAREWYTIFLEEGIDRIWILLEEFYSEIFNTDEEIKTKDKVQK